MVWVLSDHRGLRYESEGQCVCWGTHAERSRRLGPLSPGDSGLLDPAMHCYFGKWWKLGEVGRQVLPGRRKVTEGAPKTVTCDCPFSCLHLLLDMKYLTSATCLSCHDASPPQGPKINTDLGKHKLKQIPSF